MQIKSVIIDYIYYINFIVFNISTLFCSWSAQLKFGCVEYTRSSYMRSNWVTLCHWFKKCIDLESFLSDRNTKYLVKSDLKWNYILDMSTILFSWLCKEIEYRYLNNPHFNLTFGSLAFCQVLSGGRQRQISNRKLENFFFGKQDIVSTLIWWL